MHGAAAVKLAYSRANTTNTVPVNLAMALDGKLPRCRQLRRSFSRVPSQAVVAMTTCLLAEMNVADGSGSSGGLYIAL